VGQKVHPLGFRLGVYRGWDASWFARKSYGKQLIEDIKIRRFLNESLKGAEVSRVVIEKAGDNIRIIVFSGRPGVVIGKKGQEIENLKQAIVRLTGKQNVEVSVQEEKVPDTNATLVAQGIAEQLERRISFKKATKRAAVAALRAGAKGIKICCSGRLNGAEIARCEWVRMGSVPLHTLRSEVDYSLAEAKTTYGIIGVKVWICRGEFSRT
jgi:small subunit ribosomal protein S3